MKIFSQLRAFLAVQSGIALKRLPQLIADLSVLAGIAALSYGFWIAWHPLGFIVGGSALMASGILFGRSIAPVDPRRRS